MPTRTHKQTIAKLYWLNIAANLGGFIVILVLSFFTPLTFFKFHKAVVKTGDWLPVLLIIVFIEILVSFLGITLQFIIQRPVSTSLRYRDRRAGISTELFEKARRRLLNLPIILGAINLSIWITISLMGSLVQFFIRNETLITCAYLLFRGVMIGLIASTMSFFLIERHTRQHLNPVLCPEGSLVTIPGAIKISMMRRINILYMAGTTIPMKILLVTLLFAFWEVKAGVVSAADFSKEILFFTIVLYVIFIAIALRLNLLVGTSIAEPIKEMMRLVKKVRDGNFNQKIQVTTNDELGVLGDGLNEMTEGLLERDQMRQSLNLAMEIQQNLLPLQDPEVEGLDIAGKSIYCDETGGDYFDYLGMEENKNEKISMVITEF
ncbi:MAG: HAMP domain-containing protein [Deltaproteobacteria bacterium]|nr:MAG: HAMP domain-containing protein [Deltaproteobacteria bacterium]